MTTEKELKQCDKILKKGMQLGRKQAEKEFKTEGYRKRIFRFGYKQALLDIKKLIKKADNQIPEFEENTIAYNELRKLKEQINKL